MSLKTDAVGKEWPAVTYQVGREKIKEYANALGIDNPVHHDVEAARAAGFRMTGAMLGFPGEDYTTPATIQKSGGFGNPADRPERLKRFQWALDRTLELGLKDLRDLGQVAL